MGPGLDPGGDRREWDQRRGGGGASSRAESHCFPVMDSRGQKIQAGSIGRGVEALKLQSLYFLCEVAHKAVC